jgi:hypothetical protein
MKAHISEEEKQYKTITLGNLYELNKQALAKNNSLTEEEINTIKPKIEEWFNWQIDGYAILLCRERYDFTIFHLYEKANPNPPAVAVSELIETLNNRGQVLSIEKDTTNNKAWEIWIKIENEIFAYYLFNCDDWVIEC